MAFSIVFWGLAALTYFTAASGTSAAVGLVVIALALLVGGGRIQIWQFILLCLITALVMSQVSL